MTIWLIGGTQESADLAVAIAQVSFPCVVTVTTESARSLYPSAPTMQVLAGRLSKDEMEAFLETYGISCVLDASHPFAVEISQLAIATAQRHQIPYLRYERPALQKPENQFISKDFSEKFGSEKFRSENQLHLGSSTSPITYLDSFQTLLDGSYLAGQRVLLTVGYRPLNLFRSWHDRTTLFARILPSETALKAAFAAGFMADRLIALRPPISADLERALWQQWNISMVVTKASGVAGGEDTKHQVAAELGTTLVVIDRPPILYPRQTHTLKAALQFCQEHLSHIKHHH